VRDGGGTAERVALADVEMQAGNAAEARRLYDEALAKDPGSAEAMRGAARAAEALGDRPAALARWRQVVDASATGGTAWYEARLAQVKLLLDSGEKTQACEVVRLSAGRSTSTGGDQLERRLRQLAADSCR